MHAMHISETGWKARLRQLCERLQGPSFVFDALVRHVPVSFHTASQLAPLFPPHALFCLLPVSLWRLRDIPAFLILLACLVSSRCATRGQMLSAWANESKPIQGYYKIDYAVHYQNGQVFKNLYLLTDQDADNADLGADMRLTCAMYSQRPHG